MIMTKTANIGDIYAIWNETIEKWSLVQVIQMNEKNNIALLDIDFFSDETPKENQLKDLKPLIINHHFWEGDYNARFIGTNKVPKRVKFIANQAPLLDIKVTSYSSTWLAVQPTLQYKWNNLPKEITKKFKEAINSEKEVVIGERSYKIRNNRISITDGEDIIDELYKLPALTQVEIEGSSDKLLPFLKEKPLVDKLEWNKCPLQTLDISQTHLNSLTIDCTNLRYLKLNTAIRSLSLQGDTKQLIIEHPLDGQFLQIALPMNQLKDFKLPNLESIWSTGNELVDFGQIAQLYPNIQKLIIWGKPGIVKNFKAIEQLSNLRKLQLQDLFGFVAEDALEPKHLPNIEFFWLTSVPKEAGQLMKKKFKQVPHMRITKLRNEKWLAENINNPFRGWDGREGITTSNAKKAFSAFKKLNTAVEKQLSDSELITSFVTFIEVFNKMEQKAECIHTIEREEIYEIYMQLAEKAHIDTNRLFELFEEKRLF